MPQLVLLRHGESFWNRENRFTGWTDIPLTEKGRIEALEAAQRLLAEGITFDRAFTSLLVRSVESLWIVLKEMDLAWLPVEKSWRLNERHYGALQGLNKAEMVAAHGEQQVFLWRRSYDTRPPALATDDPRWPGHDRRYADIPPGELPRTESLADTVARFLPFWSGRIAPALMAGERVLIVAHGNSMRAAIRYLDGISDEAMPALYVPTGLPLVYHLDGDLRPVSSRYLATGDEIEEKVRPTRIQGKLP